LYIFIIDVGNSVSAMTQFLQTLARQNYCYSILKHYLAVVHTSVG